MYVSYTRYQFGHDCDRQDDFMYVVKCHEPERPNCIQNTSDEFIPDSTVHQHCRIWDEHENILTLLTCRGSGILLVDPRFYTAELSLNVVIFLNGKNGGVDSFQVVLLRCALNHCM